MLDHLAGNPRPVWRRVQVFLVIAFWIWRIVAGNPAGPWNRFRRLNALLSKRFTAWQLVASTLTAVYAIRNFDLILGVAAPEPLKGLYSPSFYRATWITTGLDAGFATAMTIRPNWLKDILSVIFSAYYIIYAQEAEEKLRKFRAVPTAEMLRVTWEKTTNPYLRPFLKIKPIALRRRILLARPQGSKSKRPITAWLFFSGTPQELEQATDLVLDLPGGGFISMSPLHHEERLRVWALKTKKPVLSIDYGKGPEYHYPFAIDECFDVYRLLVESAGSVIGMSGRSLNTIMTGDSAGATMAINVVYKILEHNLALVSPSAVHMPLPIALLFNYPFLDFNFTSWMSTAQKDHLHHIDPANMVGDKGRGYAQGKNLKRRRSWRDAWRGFASGRDTDDAEELPPIIKFRSIPHLRSPPVTPPTSQMRDRAATLPSSARIEDQGALADQESDEEEDHNDEREEQASSKPMAQRVRSRVRFDAQTRGGQSGSRLKRSASVLEKRQTELLAAAEEADARAQLAVGGGDNNGNKGGPIETRLTMTSRTAYFQDRIVSPSMMRAMAILWIGPHRNPDFATDYHLSPVLAPSHLLAQLPPCLLQCGEKDPFVDDTIVFAGRIKDAKRARLAELEMTLASKGAKIGESLRMTTSAESSSSAVEARLPALRKERDKLVMQEEDDWVKMVLFSDWSHGYLQMLSLMDEAMVVVEELADWLNEAFEKYSPEAERAMADQPPPSTLTSETETDDVGITFVPRRTAARRLSSSPTVERDDVLVESPRSLGSESVNGVGTPSLGSPRPHTPPQKSGSGTPRHTGQKITETELMRRRRLIDANIFGQ